MNKLFTGASTTMSLKITDDVTNKFKSLSLESTEYPFMDKKITYKSVLQYVYYQLCPNKEILWESNPNRLRVLFNRLSNMDFRTRTQKTIKDIVTKAMKSDPDFSANVRSLSDNGKRGLYYITNENLLWGVDETGHGFNFIGLAYSKSLNRLYSSYYAPRPEVAHLIYKASQLLITHFQNGHDIESFIGKPCPEYVDELMELYKTIVTFPTEETIWTKFVSGSDELVAWVRLEMDYPCNLAGFIRAEYIRYFNFYLRNRFHHTMISKYFQYLLRDKYSEQVADIDVEYHVERLFKNMTNTYKEKLANKLYYLYNDPGTTSKLDDFLDIDTRQKLYDIEIQFKSAVDIEKIEAFTPFLHFAPKETSLFIYNTREEFFELFEPYTTQLSPFTPHEFMKPRLSFMQEIYVRLISNYGGISAEQIFSEGKINMLETDARVFDRLLQKITNLRKSYFVNTGFYKKVDQNVLLKFQIYNTTPFKNEVVIVDSDPILEKSATKELFRIRSTLTELYYPITLYLSDDIRIQDRIRYRLEDFHRSLSNYRKCLSRFGPTDVLINIQQFEDFENAFYQDPENMFEQVSDETPIMIFKRYFEDVCASAVQKRIWYFLHNYIGSYQQYCRDDVCDISDDPNIGSLRTISILTANVLNRFSAMKQLTSSNLVILFEFVCDLLKIPNGYKIQNISTIHVSQHVKQAFDIMRAFTDFSRINAVCVWHILHFVSWVARQNISRTRLVFLAGVQNVILEPTPSEYELSVVFQTIVVKNADTNLKAIDISTKTAKPTKKSAIKEVIAKDNTGIHDGEQEEEESEELSDLLQELGLEEEDDDLVEGSEDEIHFDE